MQDGIMKRFEEKNGELESFELEISNIDVSHLDERERKLVSASYSLVLFGSLHLQF